MKQSCILLASAVFAVTKAADLKRQNAINLAEMETEADQQCDSEQQWCWGCNGGCNWWCPPTERDLIASQDWPSSTWGRALASFEPNEHNLPLMAAINTANWTYAGHDGTNSLVPNFVNVSFGCSKIINSITVANDAGITTDPTNAGGAAVINAQITEYCPLVWNNNNWRIWNANTSVWDDYLGDINAQCVGAGGGTVTAIDNSTVVTLDLTSFNPSQRIRAQNLEIYALTTNADASTLNVSAQL